VVSCQWSVDESMEYRIRLVIGHWTLVILAAACISSDVFAEDRSGFSTGPIAPAMLTAITPDGGIVLTAANARSTYAPDKLARWGSYVEPRRGPLVLLSDGSLIVGDPTALSGEELRIDARLSGELSLTRNLVRGIIYRLPPEDAARDALLDRIYARRDAGEWLQLANGDELSGKATGQKYDAEAGEERLLFAVGAAKELAVLPLHKLAAVAFDNVLVDDTTPRGKHILIGLRDGSLLVATGIAEKAASYDVALACGARVRLDKDALESDVVFWQPLGYGVTYLSGQADAGYKHIPFLTQAWPYHADRNCHGNRLRTGDALHFKGLGMHSTSRLAYELDGEYRQFAAELALDRSAGTRGSVIFRVFNAGDDGEFTAAYESPVIRGGDAPLPIAVDLAGVKRLALIVDFAERGDECDDANWLHARLLK
jgi:hypothetical protein